MIGYNVLEMINEWGAYAGVLPQTADPQSREVSVHLDRWGSSLAIETFVSFNIWAEQSASTSLMSYGDGRQT